MVTIIKKYILVMNLAAAIFLLPAVLVAENGRISDLDISAICEKIVYQPVGKGPANCFVLAARDVARAQEIQPCAEALLSVRHNAERMHSADEYTHFTHYVANTMLRVMADEIIDILDAVANSIRYWQYQQAHPISYFLHKHPQKYITGASQSEEINSHQTALHALQKNYFEYLGMVTEQLNILSSIPGSSAEQHKKVAQMIQQVAPLVSAPVSVTMNGISSDTILDSMVQILNHIPLFNKKAARELKLHSEPSRVEQYGLVAGLTAAGLYGLHTAIGVKADGVNRVWQNKKADLVTQVNNAFTYCDTLREQLEQGRDVADQMFRDTVAQGQTSLDVTENYIIETCDTIQKKAEFDLANARKPIAGKGAIGLATSATTEHLENYTRALIPVILQENINGYVNESGLLIGMSWLKKWLAVLAAPYNIFARASEKVEGTAQGTIKLTPNKGEVAALFGVPKDPYSIVTDTHANDARFERVYAALTVVKKTIKDSGYACIDKLDRTHTVGQTMARAAVPMMVLAGVGYWLARKAYARHDYAPAQYALAHLDRILTRHQGAQNPMSRDQVGMLVYDMHVLRTTQVPYEDKEQFEHDLADLASAAIDVSQKLRVIDRIYRNYPHFSRRNTLAQK